MHKSGPGQTLSVSSAGEKGVFLWGVEIPDDLVADSRRRDRGGSTACSEGGETDRKSGRKC